MIIEHPFGGIEKLRPKTYIQNTGKEINSSYKLSTSGEITFILGEYDKSETLVIDPLFRLHGTYYGGSGDDSFWGMTLDFNSNTYLTGYSTSLNIDNIIATNGSFQDEMSLLGDAIILKLDKKGKRVWSTYYGGSDFDFGNAIITDKHGNIYLTGETKTVLGESIFGTEGALRSTGFKDTRDSYLSKFSPDGKRLWSTYLGGWGHDSGQILRIDKMNNIVIAGFSDSENADYSFISPGCYQDKNWGQSDSFLGKFSSNGERIWCTFFGGEYADGAGSIAIDSSNNIILFGTSGSQENIATKGTWKYKPDVFDSFVAKFDTEGNRIWGTFYGGKYSESIWIPFKPVGEVVVDKENNIYIATTTITDLPDSTMIATKGTYRQIGYQGDWDGFLAKFDSTGNRIWGTYWGGYSEDYILGLSIDRNSYLYITGITGSEHFNEEIATAGCYQDNDEGCLGWNGFISKFDNKGQRIWGTYYGSNQTDELITLALGTDDKIYVSGEAESNDVNRFTTEDGCQTSYGGGYSDGIFAIFYDPTIETIYDYNILCQGEEIIVDFNNYLDLDSNNIFNLELSGKYGYFDDPIIIGSVYGTESGKISGKIPFNIESGDKYLLRISSTSPKMIGAYSDNYIQIVNIDSAEIIGDNPACNADRAIYYVEPEEGIEYLWNVSGAEITAYPSDNEIEVRFTSYESATISLTQTHTKSSCSKSQILEVSINPKPYPELDEFSDVCTGDEDFILTGGKPEGGIYKIDGMESVTFNPNKIGEGEHSVSYVYTNEFNCTDSITRPITVHSTPDKPSITRIDNRLISSADIGNQWYKDKIEISDATGKEYIPTESGDYTVTTTDENNCTSEMSESTNIVVSIQDNNESGIRIYPNPAEDYVIVENINLYVKNITLYTSMGHAIYIINNPEKNSKFNLSGFSAGLYFIEVITSDGLKYFSIIKN